MAIMSSFSTELGRICFNRTAITALLTKLARRLASDAIDALQTKKICIAPVDSMQIKFDDSSTQDSCQLQICWLR